MRNVVFIGLYAGHMPGYDEIMNSCKFVTSNTARTLHLGDAYGIREGNDANFVILDAPNYYDALNNNAAVLRSCRRGKLIAYIGKCKKQELQQMLLQLLFDGPEWQYERFLEEHWIE